MAFIGKIFPTLDRTTWNMILPGSSRYMSNFYLLVGYFGEFRHKLYTLGRSRYDQPKQCTIVTEKTQNYQLRLYCLMPPKWFNFKDVNSGCFSLWKVLRVQLHCLDGCGQEPDFDFNFPIESIGTHVSFIFFGGYDSLMTHISMAYFILSIGFWVPNKLSSGGPPRQ